MKPINWKEMTRTMQKRYATKFLETEKGQRTMAQALFIASQTLKRVDPETSQDMDLLGETLFEKQWLEYKIKIGQ